MTSKSPVVKQLRGIRQVTAMVKILSKTQALFVLQVVFILVELI